jgi:serine-type D-Ala-D-Ala carboxypeptidase (penicillin-binding protein 5/6)
MRTDKNTVILTALLLVSTVATPVAARTRPLISAKAAILIDHQTGEILWARNPDLPLPPASTTKIVTALLALQSGRLDDSLSVTPEAAQAPPSKISLRPGWRMRLRDLVYAVLLNSANDAAVVIAEGLAGSVHEFAGRMNDEARLLGARNTHFVNPNGLPAADHYSTARDLATMFSHGMENPLFEQIVSTKTTAVSPTAGSLRRITLRNHNRLLGNYRIQVVGKTGYTLAAKKCFVGAARADGREFVFAVLGSRDLWGDLKRLLEFGFDGNGVPIPDDQNFEAEETTTTAAAAGDDEPDTAPIRQAQFAVHLATFHNLQSATQLKTALVRNGYPARIETIRTGRRRLYRVAVGNYATRREAEQAASRLKKSQHRVGTLVVASR